MKQYVVDVEADNLLRQATKIHCLSYCSTDDWVVHSITDLQKIKEFMEQKDVTFIGHNFKFYDVPVMEKLVGVVVTAYIIDTLALAWYLEPMRKKVGLESYGEELGVPKPKIADWKNLTLAEYVHRCETDVKINAGVWQKQWKTLQSIYFEEPKVLDGFLRYLMFKLDCVRDQQIIGLKLDIPHCEAMIAKLEKEQAQKEKELIEAMPKVEIFTKKIIKDVIKVGDDYFRKGDMFYELYKDAVAPITLEQKTSKGFKVGNPNSSAQIKNWLYSFGWKPEHIKHVRNKETGEIKKIPQIASKEAALSGTGEICASVKKLYKKEPKLELIEGMGVLQHRIGVFKGFLENQLDGRLYPEIAGVTNTLRVKHKVIVNLPALHKKYGAEIRGAIIADDGAILCGADLSGIEDSTKRHYIWKYDPKYVEEMNVPGFDAHLDIGMRAGKITQEEVDLYKSFEKKMSVEGFKADLAEKERYKSIKTKRSKAKTANFAATYKVGAKTLSHNSGMSIKEAEDFLKVYWERNKAILQIEKALEIKVVNGQAWQRNPVNRFWYSLRTDKDKFSTLNQGTAAYVFDIWLSYQRKLGLKVPFQYHDEIAFNVKPELRNWSKEIVDKAMVETNNRLKLNVNIGCSIQWGSKYSEIH